MVEGEKDVDGERCGCSEYSDVPPPPPTLADLERRLAMRVDRLRRMEALNVSRGIPDVLMDIFREAVETTKREIRERTARGSA